MNIRIIEKILRDENLLTTTIRFTIAFHPKKDSFEIKSYERSYIIRDLELVTTTAADLMRRIKLDNARQVFDEYYKDNFL